MFVLRSGSAGSAGEAASVPAIRVSTPVGPPLTSKTRRSILGLEAGAVKFGLSPPVNFTWVLFQ